MRLLRGFVVAGAVVALRARPSVTLAEDAVVVHGPPDQIIHQFRERLVVGDEVIAAQADRVVRRFHGRAGRFRFHTVEVVTFGPSWITFEHLAGPFARCSERFDLVHDSIATTRVVHSGSFALRGGLWTWPLARGAVKSAFERLVHDHLIVLGEEFGRAHVGSRATT